MIDILSYTSNDHAYNLFADMKIKKILVAENPSKITNIPTYTVQHLGPKLSAWTRTQSWSISSLNSLIAHKICLLIQYSTECVLSLQWVSGHIRGYGRLWLIDSTRAHISRLVRILKSNRLETVQKQLVAAIAETRRELTRLESGSFRTDSAKQKEEESN